MKGFEQQSRTVQLAAIGAAISAVMLLFWWSVWQPQQQRQAVLESRCRQVEERNRQIMMFTESHADGIQYLQELDQRNGQAAMLLPEQADIAAFLLELERSARDSGVQIAQVKPGLPIARNGYREITVEVQTNGSYFSLLDFVRRVEGAKRFAAVNKAAVHSQNGALASKLVLHIYCFGTGVQATTAAAATNS